jgi:hypothetical protein
VVRLLSGAGDDAAAASACPSSGARP